MIGNWDLNRRERAPMNRWTSRLFLMAAIFATIGCDRVTKHLASTSLAASGSHSFLADTVRLQYAQNAGAFLSLGAQWPPVLRTAIFGFGTGLFLLGLTVVAVRAQWPTAARLGVALLIAGGTSNLVDRLHSGSVVDFMNLGIGPVRTGIFNVADVAIVLGVGIVALCGSRR